MEITDKRHRRVIVGCGLVVCIALVLGSAADAQAPANTAEEPSSPSAMTLPTSAQTDAPWVRIGPGDLVQMSVFDVPELAQTVRIDDKGNGVINLLGALHFAGMTPAEAQTLVANELRNRNLIVDPHVTLLIQEYGTQGVSVVGEVKKPAVYPVLGSRNLLDVIAAAGGLTPLAAHQATIHHRGEDKKPVTASLSNDPSQLLATNVELRPGDTVIIPRAGIVYVIGDVGRAGGFTMQNSGKITLLQAIALAAGVNRTAATSKTRIIRKTTTGFEEAQVDLKHLLQGKAADVALQPEDIVYIPPSSTKSILMRAPGIAQTAASAAVYSAVP